MNQLDKQLKPFRTRIKLLRAWRGLALGLLGGGVLSALWAGADWFGWLYTDWMQMGILTAACAIVGAVIGWFMKLDEQTVALSVDRRANLKDRIGTAIERTGKSDAFDVPLQTDAQSALAPVQAKRIYPVTVGKWQYASLAACALASSIFLLGNSSFLLDDKAKQAKDELNKAAERVERIAKPLEETKAKDAQAAKEKELAKELRKFAQELKKARLNKEQMMQKANELDEKAKKLIEQRAEQAKAQMDSAKSKLESIRQEKMGLTKEDMKGMKMEAEEKALLDQMMKEQGIDPQQNKDALTKEQLERLGADPSSQDLMNMTKEQRDQMQNAVDQKLSELEKKAASGKPLTENEKKLMEQLRKLSEKLKLSEEVSKALQEIANTKEFKEMQKLMQKMQEAQQQQQEGQPLSDEQLKELEQQMEEYKKQLEEMAEKWNSKEGKEEIMQMLKDALEAMKNGQQMQNQGMGLGMGLGLGMGQGDGQGNPTAGNGEGGNGGGASGPGKGGAFQNTEKVNHLDKDADIKGKGLTTGVKGQRDPTKGQESYVEIKAPTMNGSRTSVPYSQVLPKYKNQAENALNKNKIPKEHEKRVKKYFDSLTGAGK